MPRSQPAMSSSVRLRSAGERQARRRSATRRLLALLLRPEAAVREVLQHALLDPHGAPDRQTFAVERRAEQSRIGRIRVERDALVDDLLADARAAARLRERAAAFVGVARVERVAQERNEIVHRLRLEHRRVQARARSTAGCGWPRPSARRCGRSRPRSIALQSRAPARCPSAAGAVRRSRRHREVGVGRPVIGEQTRCSSRRRSRARWPRETRR